jgi:hypothetical protein
VPPPTVASPPTLPATGRLHATIAAIVAALTASGVALLTVAGRRRGPTARDGVWQRVPEARIPLTATNLERVPPAPVEDARVSTRIRWSPSKSAPRTSNRSTQSDSRRVHEDERVMPVAERRCRHVGWSALASERRIRALLPATVRLDDAASRQCRRYPLTTPIIPRRRALERRLAGVRDRPVIAAAVRSRWRTGAADAVRGERYRARRLGRYRMASTASRAELRSGDIARWSREESYASRDVGPSNGTVISWRRQTQRRQPCRRPRRVS